MSINPFIQQIQSISLQNKYTNWYCAIVERAMIRATTRKDAIRLLAYVEKHHIVPDSFFIERQRKGHKGWLSGASSHKENLVYLTAREHFICHWLLSKMSTPNTKYHVTMNLALVAMSMNGNKQGRYNNKTTSEVYENARTLDSLNKTGVKKGPMDAKRRQNISDAKIGIPLGPMTQDRKDHLSLVTSGRPKSEEHKMALRKPKSAEHKANMSKSKSEEHKANMRKPRPQTECPHCKKIGATNLLKRYHFDNCKDK